MKPPGVEIRRFHPRPCTHTRPTPSAHVPVKVGGYTPTALWARIPAFTLIHTSLCPGGCTKAGCPGSTNPLRDHPLTLHSINEDVALGALRARPPGQPEKGRSCLHHAKIHRGASTAFWRHAEPGMNPQPHVLTAPNACTHPCPYGHGHSRVLAWPDTDSPMLLGYWVVTVTRYSVPACSPRSTVLVSRGPMLTWEGTMSPLHLPQVTHGGTRNPQEL